MCRTRQGTVLVFLLAALIHLLGCAHGPGPSAVALGDSLPVVSAPASAARAPVVGAEAGAHGPAGDGHTREECAETAASAVSQPRAVADTGIAADAPVIGGGASSGSGTLRPRTAATAGKGANSRALLGVWRN